MRMWLRSCTSSATCGNRCSTTRTPSPWGVEATKLSRLLHRKRPACLALHVLRVTNPLNSAHCVRIGLISPQANRATRFAGTDRDAEGRGVDPELGTSARIDRADLVALLRGTDLDSSSRRCPTTCLPSRKRDPAGGSHRRRNNGGQLRQCACPVPVPQGRALTRVHVKKKRSTVEVISPSSG
jgi:hypothetical protein